MTYTYTPQAGDVIESPSGRKRIRVLRDVDDFDEVTTITYVRRWWLCGPWTIPYLGGWSIKETYTLDNLVTDHGWKLVARRGHG